MLRLKAVPLVHSGYRLAAPADGCDLEHIGLTGATAPQLVAQLVQQVHEGGQQLWGALPDAPSRPVLLQCAPDLLCADWEQIQQALAAPMLQQGNALQAAATAVAAAAAAVAAATGRGEDQAAASAAAAAAGAAAAAVSAAQAMGSVSTPQPSLAPAETEAAAAVEATVSAEGGCDEELPAASPDAGDSSVPVSATVSQQTAALDSNTSAATPRPGAQQLEEAAGLAAAAGAFAAASQPSSSSSSTLRRGAGLLVLLRNGWRGKARPLNGSLLVRGVAYTCYSIVQLMSHEGLLLHKGHQQAVRVRVAAEFLGAGSSSDVVGAWSKQTFSVDVWPEETLLLHCQPPQPVGKKFKSYSSACTHTHEALFGWTPAVVTAALGKRACLRGVWHLGCSSCCPAHCTCSGLAGRQ
jgi:hypothetical protein